MKKVLVVYYTQSGQLKQAIDATLRNFQSEDPVSVEFLLLKPLHDFPFPWTHSAFFDQFADTVSGKPIELAPYAIDEEASYDLVLLAYQPWFLSVSRPMYSFLQSEFAAKLLKGKPVVTLVACRNMWINAQEKMKARLEALGASLKGHLVFCDPSSNLVSLVTVLAFAFKGEMGKFMGVFPKYGVSESELSSNAWRYGDAIKQCILKGNYDGLQERLVGLGAVPVKPNLLIMEGRGKKLFPLYARFISNGSNERARFQRAKMFGFILPILILALSPIITLVSLISPVIFRKSIKAKMAYHQGLTYSVGR
jgi:flavodoxin